MATPAAKVIHSPDYPGEYCNALSCKWLITATVYHQVHLVLTSFRTEAGEDYLSCFDGRTQYARRIARLSGSIYRRRSVVSSGRYLLLWFTTDGSVTLRGWTGTYSSRQQASSGRTNTPRRGIRTTTPRSYTTPWRTLSPIVTKVPEREEKSSGGTSGWVVMGPILLILLLIIGGVLLYFFVLRDRLPVWYAQFRGNASDTGTSYANPTSNAPTGILPQGYRHFHRESQTALVTDD